MNDLLRWLTPSKVALINKSRVLHDREKVRDLESIVPEERQKVLVQHVILGVDWEEAMAAAPKIPATEFDSGGEPSPDANPNRLVQRWRVDALKPNPWNEKLFSRSLSKERIQILADDIRRRGQRTPIEIVADGTALDGNCRVLAHKILGWDMIDAIIVADTMSEVEMLRYAVDAATSQRIMSVREQVMVYQALLELARFVDPRNQDREGEPNPDPQNEDRDSVPNLDPQNEDPSAPREVRNAMAKRAGFRSYETARRARRVFREGDDETQRLLDAGELSVNGAHERLPAKRAGAKDKAKLTGASSTEAIVEELGGKVVHNPSPEGDDEPETPATPPTAPTPPRQGKALTSPVAPPFPKNEEEPELDPSPSDSEAEPVVDDDEPQEGGSDVSVEDARRRLDLHFREIARVDADGAMAELRTLARGYQASIKEAAMLAAE